jgi:hypothetical protein
MYAMIQKAAHLAMEATREIFGAASSSAAKRGARMQRLYRDMSIYLGHISARHDVVAAEVARMHFGLEDGLFLQARGFQGVAPLGQHSGLEDGLS